jgi:hypothetical protein
MQPGDWDVVFGRDGARWFHCGGIFAALPSSTAPVALEAMAAGRHGTISCPLGDAVHGKVDGATRVDAERVDPDHWNPTRSLTRRRGRG